MLNMFFVPSWTPIFAKLHHNNCSVELHVLADFPVEFKARPIEHYHNGYPITWVSV